MILRRHSTHERVALSLDVVADVIRSLLTQPSLGTEVAQEAIKCFQVSCLLSSYMSSAILIGLSLGYYMPVVRISTRAFNQA